MPINLYAKPKPRATPLILGKCSGIDSNLYDNVLTQVPWFGYDGARMAVL